MRIALISDIHGNLPALEAVVADFKRRGIDAVINLGDSLSGPLYPHETAQFLMAQTWTHLAGNHERQILNLDPAVADPADFFARSQLTQAELAWLATLQPVGTFGEDMFICHGTPFGDSQYLLETVEPTTVRLATPEEIHARLGGVAVPLIACGHTHLPRSVRSSTGQLIVNPGSVGLQAFADTHPYPHIIENGSADARYAIVEKRNGHWVPALIAVPYDHASVAPLARQRGLNDWARALQTGYIKSNRAA